MEIIFLVLLIVLMIAALSSGFPVAFALPGSAIVTIAIAALTGFILNGDSSAFFVNGGPNQWLSAGVTNFRSLYWNVERDTLIAIPLFIFMGLALQRSRIAEDLLIAMAKLFGPVPGGLGISVVFVGALLAATTGIVGATVIAMGLISLPAMLRNNYSKELATGTICASGTLGQIIPPSIVLIILADQLSSAADQAGTIRKQLFKDTTGEFSMPSTFDIVSASAGDMFMGAFIPGLILVTLYMIYVLAVSLTKPEKAPPVPYEGKYDRHFFTNIVVTLVPPLVLIFVVLGSIVLGVATVNQAGAIGAVGALLMGSYRLTKGLKHAYTPALLALASVITLAILINTFDLNIKNIQNSFNQTGVYLAVFASSILLYSIGWAIVRVYRIDNTLNNIMTETAKTTSMVFIILLGAAMLTSAFRAFGGEELVKQFLTGLPGGFWIQFLVVMLVIFLLGFFLDFIEIAIVVVPLVAPILLADPSANITAVWLGVMIGLNIQTSFLTPPFGFALFYLRGVAPAIVKTIHIYKGAIAFIALQLTGLVIAGLFPVLINYLPNRMHLSSDTAPPPNNPRLQQCIEALILPKYASIQQPVEEQLASLSRIDNSFLPHKVRTSLNQAIGDIPAVFSLAEEVQRSNDTLTTLASDYAPLHRLVRTEQRDIRLLKRKIQATQDKIDDLRFSGKVEDIPALEQDITRFKQKIDTLEASLPQQWQQAHSQYLTQSRAHTAVLRTYRNLVDTSYNSLMHLRLMLEQTDELQSLYQRLERLNTDMNNEDQSQIRMQLHHLIEDTKTLYNTGNLVVHLQKAISNLEQNGDTGKALHELDQARAFINAEIRWRLPGKAQLLPAINKLDQLIADTIGLRMQSSLPQSMVPHISLCLSHHKDISLSF